MTPACQKRSEETSSRHYSLDHCTAIQRLLRFVKTVEDSFTARGARGRIGFGVGQRPYGSSATRLKS